jgi:hypothetical protein
VIRKRDVIEIVQIKKSGLWMSRFYEKGSEEALLSIPPAPTRQRALEVATKANRLLFCGSFRLPKPIKEQGSP